MAEIIRFPNEENRLDSQIKQALAADDQLRAQQLLVEKYAQTPDFATNIQLLCLYREQGAYEQAIQLANDYFAKYLDDAQAFTEYFRLLLLDQQFVFADYLLRQIHQQLPEETVTQLRVELQQMLQVQALVAPHLMEDKTRELQQLAAVWQPMRARSWQQFIRQVSPEQLKELLINELPTMSNPFVVPKICEEMVRLDLQMTATMTNYLGTQQTIDSRQLALPHETPSYQHILQKLMLRFADNKPDQYIQVAQEVQSDFALMYPTTPQENEMADWLLYYELLVENPEIIAETTTLQDICQKKQKLAEIVQKITFIKD